MARGRKGNLEATSKKHLTIAEKEARIQANEVLKGSGEIIAPDYLTKEQTDIFNFVVDGMKAANFFGSLDVFLLAQYSVCVDRLTDIECQQNEDIEKRFNKDLMSARKTYSADFLKYGLELGLSPTARARVGIYAAEQKKAEANPVLGILKANEK